MPIACAVFHPTVIDMSFDGASGVSTWVGGIHRSSNFSSGPGMRQLVSGVIDSDCTPPAIRARSMPDPICADGVADRGQAPRAVPVDRLAGDVLQAGRVGGVAGEIAAAVMGFGEDDVVDGGRVDAGPADHLGQDRRDQGLGRGVDQSALERRPIAVRTAPTMTGVDIFK